MAAQAGDDRCTSPALDRAENGLALCVTGLFVLLLFVRVQHAGGLWRDECDAVQVARLPTIAAIVDNLPSGSFPLLFPLALRGYTTLCGTGDRALRAFGLLAAAACVAALWIGAGISGTGPPLFSLALLGLNADFLTWGTTVRGYGLGTALIILVFGLTARLVVAPPAARVTAVAIAAVASVHCVFHNVVLVLAITTSGVIVSLARGYRTRALALLGTVALTMLSLLLYRTTIVGAREMQALREFPVSFEQIGGALSDVLGGQQPVLAWIWYGVLAAVLGGAVRRLWRVRDRPGRERDLLLFGLGAALLSLLGQFVFLDMLGYFVHPWYLLGLVSILAVALDVLSGQWRAGWVRRTRLALLTAMAIAVTFANWPAITARQTNVDLVAHAVEQQARAGDLIVVNPWHYGVAFDRYYRGPVRWETLPILSDHRLHRYDLINAKIKASAPLADLYDAIRGALQSAHRVWLVGALPQLLPGELVMARPLAGAGTGVPGGLALAMYTETWSRQVGVFIQTHAASRATVPIPNSQPVNEREDLSLSVVEGWREP